MVYLTQYEGVDPMHRYGTPAIVMYANLDLPNDLPHPSSPRHTPERHVKAPRIDQQGQPCIILPPRRFETPREAIKASVTSVTPDTPA